MGFKVKISLEVTNADGTPFFNNSTEYADMPYHGVVVVERKLVDALSSLVAEGEAQVAAAAATGV